jgi:hypothetical protein
MLSVEPVAAILAIASALRKLPLFETSDAFRSLRSDLCSSLSWIRLNALPPDRRAPFQRVVDRILNIRLRNDTFLHKDLEALEDLLRSYWHDVQRDSRLMGMLLLNMYGPVANLDEYSEQAITFNRRLLVEEGLVLATPVMKGGYIHDFEITSVTHEGVVFMKEADGLSGNATSRITVFVSHSSRDSELARALVDLLRAALNIPAHAIRCTSLDGYRLPLGVSTDSRLRDELIQAKSFIGILTPSSLYSTYVLFEIGARWGAKLNILPVSAAGLDAEKLSGPLRGINVLALGNTANAHQLIQELASELGLDAQPAASYVRQLQAVVHAAEAAAR